MFTLCGIPYGVSVHTFFYVYVDNGFGKWGSCDTKYMLNCHKNRYGLQRSSCFIYCCGKKKRGKRFEKLQVVCTCILQPGDTEM